MQIIKEKLDIDEVLEQRIKNTLKFLNIKSKITKGMDCQHFFRELLQIGNDKVKEATTSEIKDYYDNKDFDKDDVYDIAIDTDKEDELFDYADIDKYYSKDDLEL